MAKASGKKRKKGKGNSAETTQPVNWALIGSIVGIGVLLLGGIVLWQSASNDGDVRTGGEIVATREAEATASAVAAEQQAATAFTSLTAYCDTNPSRCIVEGESEANNIVFEFSDYSCPHCKTFIDQQYPLIKSQLIETGEIKYVTIPAPILGQTPNTPLSVNATLCAVDQARGGDYHVGVYGLPRDGREASQTSLLSLGKSLGLEMDAFSACVENNTNEQAALANRAIVFEAGINSTPTLLLNGQQVDASAQAIGAAIADARRSDQ